MFVRKKELLKLITYLEEMIADERQARWKLEGDLNLLLKHLNLELVTQPRTTIRKKTDESSS